MTKKPQVIAYNADFSGCGFWRVLWPEFVLNMKGRAVVSHFSNYIRDFVLYSKVDVVFLQRQGTPYQKQFFEKLSELKGKLNFRLVYDADDIFFPEDVPGYNHARLDSNREEIVKSTKETIELCDEMVVSTPFLRKYYLQKTDQPNISVIPNFPPMFWIGLFYSEEHLLRNYEKHRKRPRIIYAGSASHFDMDGSTEDEQDDFYHVRHMIEETRKEFCWVFIGQAPRRLRPYIESKEIEVHPWQTIENFPRYLALLQGNMMIAPLANNLFNRAKSGNKFLESCAVGLPIACQNLECYEEALIKFDTAEEMLTQVRETLQTKESFIASARAHRRHVEGKWLELNENIGHYYDLFSYPYGDPHRQFLKGPSSK